MRLFRYLAAPIALIYGLVISIRNVLYNLQVLPSKQFHTPVVSVGNLQLGGTGKSPMIEWLIRYLQQDHQLAVVSRGYKRETKGMVVAGPGSTARSIGDEPYQIYRKFPGITLVVDGNRIRAIDYLESRVAPDIILLDDAHQHRKVRPVLSLVLTVYGDLFADDWWLPTGSLRDAKFSAKRADFIVVTKCPPDLSGHERDRIKARIKPIPGQQVLFTRLAYGNVVKRDTQEMTMAELKDREFTLVTGIAKPGPLVDYLEGLGLAFDHIKYPDHHRFSEKDLAALSRRPLLITTEKDAARLAPYLDNYYYLEVEHEFLADGEKLLINSLKAL